MTWQPGTAFAAGPRWARVCALAGFGALAGLAQAPVNRAELVVLALVVLAVAVQGAVEHFDGWARRARSAALAGWAFGFGQFAAGLYWIAFAFQTDPALLPLMPPLMVLLVSGLAVFPAAACALVASQGARGVGLALGLGGALTLAEMARGRLFGGFPWNLHGFSLGADNPIMQVASLIGGHGVSMLLIMSAMGFGLLLLSTRRSVRLAGPGLAILALVSTYIHGWVRLESAEVTTTDTQIRLVHPSIPQDRKWDRAQAQAFFLRHIDLTLGKDRTPAGAEGIDIVLWPESATGFPLGNNRGAQNLIAEAAGGATVMAGSVRWNAEADGPANSVFVFSTAGSRPEVLAIYDKRRLVPFGEFVPLNSVLSVLGLDRFNPVGQGFIAGDQALDTILPGGGRTSILICYEVIFPGLIPQGDRRPDWVAHLTNDGWFGPSTGPLQHFERARLRAIETGLPIARAANNGVSGLIDPLGRVVDDISTSEPQFLDVFLPNPQPQTYFQIFKDIPVLLMGVLLVGAMRFHISLKFDITAR